MNSMFIEVYSDECFSKKLTYTSFILSIMIVYTHAINYFVFPLEEGIYGRAVYWLEYTFHMLFCAAVPLFYIMSGFMFFRNFSIRKYPDKLKKRFFSLVIPYLFWNFAAYFVMVVATRLPGISSIMSADIDVSLYGMLYATGMGTYNVLWFVRNLICFVVISPVIYAAVRRKILGLLVLVALAVSNLIWTGTEVKSLLYTVLFFALGGYLSLNWPDLFRARLKRTYCIAGIVLIFVMVVWLSFSEVLGTMWRQPLLVILALLVWFALDIIDYRKAKTPLVLNMAFFTYCTHCLVIETFENLWMYVFGKTVTSALTNFLFAPVLTLIVVFSVGYLLKIKLPRVYRIVAGGR